MKKEDKEIKNFNQSQRVFLYILKYRYHIALVFVFGAIYFISSIESNLLRILIGTPMAAIGIYSANIIGGFSKEIAKNLALLAVVIGTLLFIASFLGILFS